MFPPRTVGLAEYRWDIIELWLQMRYWNAMRIHYEVMILWTPQRQVVSGATSSSDPGVVNWPPLLRAGGLLYDFEPPLGTFWWHCCVTVYPTAHNNRIVTVWLLKAQALKHLCPPDMMSTSLSHLYKLGLKLLFPVPVIAKTCTAKNCHTLA